MQEVFVLVQGLEVPGREGAMAVPGGEVVAHIISTVREQRKMSVVSAFSPSSFLFT